ncbi:TetR/AcrR family transcriptional regulator [Streptomyces sp. Ru73]|uniref:TetR/AcrR family transcriptional regulator n=1 Tax=Streptomyces sp. Ru73 TaxID=2080748 RepID=UPI0015E3FC68|nr:TetR/AcrR family transcriptional regulator [Streptomyces sp. Ru73]
MAAGRGRPSFSEDRRQATRMAIAEAAATLFSDHGYEATTVEHIAAAAGISLRTFYRYCPAKEDALTPVFTSSVSGLVDRLAALPADQPLAEAVEAAFAAPESLRRLADADRARRLLRVMGAVPALRTRWLAAGREMQDRLAPVLAPRTGGDPDSMETRLLAAALIDAITVAMEYWAREEGDAARLAPRADAARRDGGKGRAPAPAPAPTPERGPADAGAEGAPADIMALVARALRYLRIDDR